MAAVLIPAELSAALTLMPASRRQRYAAIVDWGWVQLLDSAIDAYGVENVVKEAQAAYDAYCVQIDIPWLDDAQEAMFFDPMARKGIALLIRGFHDQIHRTKTEGPMKAAAAPRTWIGEAA